MSKYLPGHLKRNLHRWINRKWYHQRFDGCLYFLGIISEAEIKDELRKRGTNDYVHYCFFEEGKADWYIEWGDIKRIYTLILKAGKKNPWISSDLIEAWQKDQYLFYQACLKVGKVDLTKLSNEELIKLHDQFLEITINKNSSSSTIDGFALGTDEMIAEKIRDVYEKSKLKETIRFAEVFSTLTAPVHLSFINEAEVALLKVAVAIRKDPVKKQQLLEEHQKKYFWIRNNYVDANILTVKDFESELEKLFSLDIDIKEEIEKIETTPKINKKKKKELMRKLKIDDELKLLIKISEDFTYWQDERKKSTFWTTHYFSLILKEICRRVKIPVEELKHLSAREVSDIFENKPDLRVLQERRKNSVFYWDTEGHECLFGKEADAVKKAILGSISLSQIDDFRGLTASMGKATGRVKVVKSAKEIGKVQPGDILVAVMTRPDYVPAMKKAAAIVTDEGGVTCHAAIVSRELGIPCIIGTKIATSILKDGMQIEVNANHSWIRILKGNKS